MEVQKPLSGKSRTMASEFPFSKRLLQDYISAHDSDTACTRPIIFLPSNHLNSFGVGELPTRAPQLARASRRAQNERRPEGEPERRADRHFKSARPDASLFFIHKPATG